MNLFLKKNRRRRIIIWGIFFIVLLCGLFAASFFYYLHTEVKTRFSSRRWSVPARVFSSTVPVYPGQALSISGLRRLFEERSYKEASKEPLRAGEFRTTGASLVVHLRDFQFPGVFLPSQLVRFDLQQGRIARITGPEGELAFLELEPLEIARLFGPNRESRMLINIRQVPRYLVDAVVAIEDHRFFEHSGVDLFGILRALFTDVREGRVVQGGSTITQQLVKNYFLQSERSLRRKVPELPMALSIEALYDKDEILEIYLNEIYMGQRGSVAIHGIGEASRYYFGRNVEDLTLSEAAALAGMIKGPNSYSPLSKPQAAIDRRNLVLRRMLDLRKISPDEYDAARIEPLKVAGNSTSGSSIAPYFIDYVRKQAQELYASDALASEGLSIYTTLHPEMALAADTAIREGLQEIERDISYRQDTEKTAERLQAVLIALQPRTGAIYALVGGRDYGESTFNRALQARRQPGSALKPFVYLSALDRFKLSDWLSDLPVPYDTNGESWTPRNYDNRYRGKVSFRDSLEQSLNAATVNLAMQTGLDNVIGVLKSFGIESPLEPVPSLALGAFELSPVELACAYAVLANDGQKPFLLSLKEIIAEDGEIQARRNIDFSSVTSPEKAFLVTNLLEGAIERGTARVLKRLGVDFKCAGKTGTSSDYRDSWFIGYTNDLLVLVWVGYDDGRPAHLTGAQGAARIWARFFSLIRPWVHPQEFDMPPGIVQRIVCPDSGQLATTRCREHKLEYFLSGSLSNAYCTIHGNE